MNKLRLPKLLSFTFSDLATNTESLERCIILALSGHTGRALSFRPSTLIGGAILCGASSLRGTTIARITVLTEGHLVL
jgi:hypothetical protein